MIQDIFYNITADNPKLCPVGFGGRAPTYLFYKFTVDKNKLLPPMCPHQPPTQHYKPQLDERETLCTASPHALALIELQTPEVINQETRFPPMFPELMWLA